MEKLRKKWFVRSNSHCQSQQDSTSNNDSAAKGQSTSIPNGCTFLVNQPGGPTRRLIIKADKAAYNQRLVSCDLLARAHPANCSASRFKRQKFDVNLKFRKKKTLRTVRIN